MRNTVSTIAVVGTVCAVALFAVYSQDMPSSNSLFMKDHPREKEFQEFVSKYRRSYGTKAEHSFRRELFAKTLDFIEAHNSENSLSTMAVNKFSDWTQEEK